MLLALWWFKVCPQRPGLVFCYLDTIQVEVNELLKVSPHMSKVC